MQTYLAYITAAPMSVQAAPPPAPSKRTKRTSIPQRRRVRHTPPTPIVPAKSQPDTSHPLSESDSRRAENCLVYAYNIEMKSHAKKNHLKPCLHLLTQMRQQGVHPDKYTYSTLLTTCARTRNTNVALQLYESLRKDALPLDDHLRTTLLTVAANASPPLISLCADLFQSASRPNLIMCNVLMDAYARSGDVVHCEATYRYMRFRGLYPDHYTASALVKAHVKNGQLDAAVEALTEMHAAGIDVPPQAFSQVIDAFGKAGDLDSAISVFDIMVIRDIKPTLSVYNVLISACAETRNKDRAFEIYEEMRVVSPFRGDRYTLHSLIRACLNVGEGSQALKVYSWIYQSKFLPNQVTYRMGLVAAGQALDLGAVFKIVQDMKENNCSPREDTAAALVAAFIRCSDLESALAFFDSYMEQCMGRDMGPFFEETRSMLKACETGSHNPKDFEQTTVVVNELQRSWRNSL